MNSICQKLIDSKGGLNRMPTKANNISTETAAMIEIRKCLILNRFLFMCLSFDKYSLPNDGWLFFYPNQDLVSNKGNKVSYLLLCFYKRMLNVD